MGVEEVRQRRFAPASATTFSCGLLAVAQAGPEVDDPGPAPAGVAAAVGEPVFERLPGRGRPAPACPSAVICRPGCRANRCDMCRWPGSASSNSCDHSISRPSEPICGPSSRRRALRDLRARNRHRCPGPRPRPGQLVNRSQMICWSIVGPMQSDAALAVGGDEGVLRRGRRPGDELAGLRILDEPVEIELGRLLHDRVDPLRRNSPVAAEGVVLPEVLAQPRAGRGEQAPAGRLARRGEAPDVRDRVHHPAVGAVVDLARSCARWAGASRSDRTAAR